MATEDNVCYRPFNHLKFFIGPVIAAGLAGILRFIYIHSDSYAQGAALILGVIFIVASIVVHAGCLMAYRNRYPDFKYRPTVVSAIVVSVIQCLMFTALIIAIWQLLKLHLHN